MLLYLSVSQHVSAPTGHPQVNIINYLGVETCCDTERYNNINKLSVAIAGICLKDSYVYITQQDAPHKDKKTSVLYIKYCGSVSLFSICGRSRVR
jgi:hypothetical protein